MLGCSHESPVSDSHELRNVAQAASRNPQSETAGDRKGAAEASDTVLLLHGMGRTSASFKAMHQRLERAGYHVIDWGYPSFTRTIDQHADRLTETLRRLDQDPSVARIHVVTHSLGGIVTRKALLEAVPARMGRVVMLAPPHRGSKMARRTAPVLGWWVKPLGELSSAPDSKVNRMGVPEGVEIGIIAAARDGKVRVEDTHLPGETDHLVVPGFHTFIMNSREVQDQTLAFLKTGRFERNRPSTAQGTR